MCPEELRAQCAALFIMEKSSCWERDAPGLWEVRGT